MTPMKAAYRETSPSLRHHDREESQRLEEHRQHRFDKDKDPGRGRPGGRHHDRGERKSAAMQPEDARF